MGWLKRIFGRKQQAAESHGDFPVDWLTILDRGLPCYRKLSSKAQQTLRGCIQTFVAAKEFIAHDGVQITDEIKVTIAGNACVLLIGIPHFGVFPRLKEIIVRPHVFGQTVEAIGPDGQRYQIQDRRAGEAWRRGPVVLAWDSVRRSVASSGDGFNVVYHEFAHVLDACDGEFQGAPPLKTKEQQADWARVFRAEYDAFTLAEGRGERTFINPYGATGPEEFFAVVTEHFFEQPRKLRSHHPAIYEQLKRFFQQDPARWGRSAAWT